MDTQRSRFSFDILPVEIIMQILSFIPFLDTLIHLVRASPQSRRILHQIGPDIIDKLLVKDCADEVVALVRFYAYLGMVKSRPRPSRELSEVQGRVGAAVWSQGTMPALSLVAHLHPPLGQQILDMLSNAFHLSSACFAQFRRNCKSQPRACLADKESVPYSTSRMPWREKPSDRRCPPVDIGPPDWEEGQRLLQGVLDLRLLSWVTSDVGIGSWGTIAAGNHAQRYKEYRGTHKERFDTVWDCLSSLPRQSRKVRLLSDSSFPYENFVNWPPMTTMTRKGSLKDVSAGDIRLNIVLSDDKSPVKGMPRWPFRDLGISLFSEEKSQALISGPATQDNMFHMCKSILYADFPEETVES